MPTPAPPNMEKTKNQWGSCSCYSKPGRSLSLMDTSWKYHTNSGGQHIDLEVTVLEVSLGTKFLNLHQSESDKLIHPAPQHKSF